MAEIKIGDKTSTGTVVDKMMTGIKPIWELELSDGKKLRATGDHKIFANNGKKRLDALRYGDIIKVCKITSSLRGRITDGMDCITLPLVDASMAGSVCMSQYGSSTMALSRPAVMSTIKILIERITTFLTSNFLNRVNTYLFMQRETLKTKSLDKNSKSILQASETLQNNGIEAKTEMRGIASTAKSVGLTRNFTQRIVSSVGENIKHLSLLVLNSVIRIVGKLNFDRSVWVIGARPLNISEKVYNLTIEPAHNYYANGILVANCDALRYAVLSRPYEPKYPKYRRELAVREKELQRVGGIKKQGDWYDN